MAPKLGRNDNSWIISKLIQGCTIVKVQAPLFSSDGSNLILIYDQAKTHTTQQEMTRDDVPKKKKLPPKSFYYAKWDALRGKWQLVWPAEDEFW